jgi:hypothetical protein
MGTRRGNEASVYRRVNTNCKHSNKFLPCYPQDLMIKITERVGWTCFWHVSGPDKEMYV